MTDFLFVLIHWNILVTGDVMFDDCNHSETLAADCVSSPPHTSRKV